MFEQAAAVLIVLGLLLVTLWALRRKGIAKVRVGLLNRGRSSKHLEIVEQMPLTPSHSLHLVRVKNRLILIGVSPGSCSALESLTPAETSLDDLEGR